MTKLRSFGVLTFVATLIVAGCSSPLKKGQTAFLRKDFDKSVIELEKAVGKLERKHNDYSIVKLNLATALWEQGSYDAAKKAFDDVSSVIWGPRSKWGQIEDVGLLRDESKRTWTGEENERLFIRFYTGLLYLMKREYDEAIVEFKRCNNINPNYIAVHYFWGLASREVEDENSLMHFKKAKELSDRYRSSSLEPNPYFDLQIAFYHSLMGDNYEAESVYKGIYSSIKDNQGVSNYSSFAKNGTNVSIFIEKGPNTSWGGSKWGSSKENVRIKINNVVYGKSYYLDTSGSRQAFGDALKGAATEAVGQGARDVITGTIPLSGLFMGGKRDSEVASWFIKPYRFNVFETYLSSGDYEVVVECLDKKGKVKKKISKKIKIVGRDLHLIPVML